MLPSNGVSVCFGNFAVTTDLGTEIGVLTDENEVLDADGVVPGIKDYEVQGA